MAKNKDYLTLANERAETNKKDKADKIELEYAKLDYKTHKDKTSHIISLICALPIIILILVFVIVFIVLLCK